MDRDKQTAVLPEENIFGAVAVMDVEVVNGDSFEALGARLKGGDCNRIKIAKAHRLSAGRVMTGWSHQAETDFAGTRRVQGLQCAADGAPGVIGDIRISGRVGIEIGRRVNVFEMFGGMCTEQNGVIDRERFGPCDGQGALRTQRVEGSRDALRSFGVAAAGVFDATFVRDDFHFEACSAEHYTNDIELNKEFQTGS